MQFKLKGNHLGQRSTAWRRSVFALWRDKEANTGNTKQWGSYKKLQAGLAEVFKYIHTGYVHHEVELVPYMERS